MYLAGRREYRTNPRVNNRYSVTKSWMAEVGLREYWEREDAAFEDHEGEEEEPARAGAHGTGYLTKSDRSSVVFYEVKPIPKHYSRISILAAVS